MKQRATPAVDFAISCALVIGVICLALLILGIVAASVGAG
jgi:hypothetical protein